VPLPVVHVVTTPELLTEASFPARAAAVMRALGPRGAVHLRGPGLPARVLHDLACRLVPVQAATGCWIVVNDRVDVAIASGAAAVQLTSRSLGPADARRAAAHGRPGLRVGASVHAPDEARVAEAEGADWVVAGHVYDTSSHPGAPGRGIVLVRDVAAAATVPVVAIGGVTPARVPLLRAAGAHGVAVIRGVWAAGDAERAATDYLAFYDADADGDAGARRDDRPDGERRAP
jgi:thiamine-phosphate diphosphorylase